MSVVFSQMGLAATGRFRSTVVAAGPKVVWNAAAAILVFNTRGALFANHHTCLLRLGLLIIPQSRSDRSFGLLSDWLASLLIDCYLPRIFLPSGQTQFISRFVSSL